jgi:hypothetical protein
MTAMQDRWTRRKGTPSFQVPPTGFVLAATGTSMLGARCTVRVSVVIIG